MSLIASTTCSTSYAETASSPADSTICEQYGVESPCIVVGALALDTLITSYTVSKAKESAALRAVRAQNAVVAPCPTLPKDKTPYDWTDVFTTSTIVGGSALAIGFLLGIWIAL